MNILPHILRFYRSRLGAVLIHVLCWVTFYSLPYLLITDPKPATIPSPPKPYDASPNPLFYFNSLLLVGVFYLNSDFLAVRFLSRNRIGWYIASLAATVAASVVITNLFQRLYCDQSYKGLMNASPKLIFPLLTILFLSVAYRMTLDSRRQQKIMQERQTEHLQTELKFLRSQVNPHFLLNVLNSLVALARKKSEDLEPSLMKLSHLLQFMLYDADQTTITISEEVDYLENYIALQKMRFGHKVDIRFSAPSGLALGQTIAPMLLIPLVENAFKHGVGMVETPVIDIQLDIQNNILSFTVSNTYNASETKDGGSGIGLNNLRRRLELLYPGQYTFTTTAAEPWFTAGLVIRY